MIHVYTPERLTFPDAQKFVVDTDGYLGIYDEDGGTQIAEFSPGAWHWTMDADWEVR